MKNRKVLTFVTTATVTMLLLTTFPQTAYADAENSTYSISENAIPQEPVISSTPEASTASIISPAPEASPEPVISTLPDTPTVPVVSGVPELISVTGIALDRSSAALTEGESLSLLPTIYPIDAANKSLRWTSDTPEVANVDDTGKVTAIREGSAIITATTEDGGFSAFCTVNVLQLFPGPANELAVAQNYDSVKVMWDSIPYVTGYEVYRSDVFDGVYTKVATVLSTEYSDTGLKTGTVYYYKVRAYQVIDNSVIYSDYTQVITVKTLDKSIGSTLFLYMSSLGNRNSVFSRAVSIHYGDPSNTCAITVSEAFRRIGIAIPTSTFRTNQVESQLIARGWKREMNLKLLQPGDICFTTDKYGNYLGGHSTHTFIFMGWANKQKTLMNIADNQVSRYGSVLHTRTIYRTSLTDATAFFYHTNTPSVDLILKLTSAAKANSVAYNKVNISWNAAVGAYGYKLYRSTSKYGIYNYLGTTKSTNYVDSYVTPGKTYYYKLRAYNYVGSTPLYGSYSGITAATPVLTKPSAYASLFTNGKVKLTWSGVSGASGYQIYRAASKSGTYYRLTSTANTSYTNTGLTSGKSYYYKVRAYRYVGNTKVYSSYSYLSLITL